MSNKPDKSNFLRAESELVLDLVSRSVREVGGFIVKPKYPQARQQKEKKIADLGSPIKLKGQALDMYVRGNSLWIAENTGSVLVIDLTVCCTISSLTLWKLTATSPDEGNDLDVQMSPGAPLRLRLRGQNSRIRGRKDHDYRFMG